MEIVNSTIEDTGTIFKFYDMAVAYQKTKFNKHWQGFNAALIKKEIEEKRQYKILEGSDVACIFAVTFNDAVIWGERDKEPSIYIHRIVTHTAYRGNNFVNKIIEWAVDYGSKNDKQFVRMDTWGDNEKLIEYYQNCGFKFLGLTEKMNGKSLPEHYNAIRLSLFEINIWQQLQANVQHNK